MYPVSLTANNQMQYIAGPILPAVNLPTTLPVPMPVVNQSLPFNGEILQKSCLAADAPTPLLWNGMSWENGSFVSCPTHLECFNGLGQRVCPPGFSFVLMDVPATQIPTPLPVSQTLNVPEEVQVNSISCPPSPAFSSVSVGSVNSRVFDRQSWSSPSESVTPEQTPAPEITISPPIPEQIEEPKPHKNRKFRHRSKQERIEAVYQHLQEKYTAKGLYASHDEVLRGFDTVRVHVKRYHALGAIEDALDDVEHHPFIQIKKIATPFSMKNKFQKKGFIVYLKLTDERMVELVQKIFARDEYAEHFDKCDLALRKEDKERLIAQQEAQKKRAAQSYIDAVKAPEMDYDFCVPGLEMSPPNMAPRSSNHMTAA